MYICLSITIAGGVGSELFVVVIFVLEAAVLVGEISVKQVAVVVSGV